MIRKALLAAAFAAFGPGGAANAEDAGFVDCNAASFAQNAHLDPGFQCAEGARQMLTAGGRTIGVRSLYDKRSGEVLTSYAVLVMQATKKAVETYAGLPYGWEFANITVIVTDPQMKDGGVPVPHKEHFEKVLADADPMTFPTDCIVRLSAATVEGQNAGKKNAGALGQAEIGIAHEVFHCVQGWNYRAQMLPDPGRWWVESTATLFSSLVYDGRDHVHALAVKFANQIATKALTRQPYTGVYFFAWLWGKSPDDVVKLMAAMPTSGGEAEQQAAVYGFLRDRLDEFARDAIDGKVKDVAGNPLPAPTPMTRQEFTETRSVDLGVTPFELFYQELSFKDGMYYFGADAPNDLYNRKADAGSEWASSSRFFAEGACGKTLKYYIAGMRGAPGIQKLRFTAERITGECVECAAIPEKDQCLVGQWRINNESMVNAIADSLGESVEHVTVSGFGGMNVRADGTHSFAFKSFTVEGKPAASAEGATFFLRLIGVIDSKWGAKDGNMSLCYAGSEATLQMKAGGSVTEPISFEDMMTMGGSRREDYTYRCNSRAEIFLTMKVDGQSFLVRFDRLD